jgi:hypothetical protein
MEPRPVKNNFTRIAVAIVVAAVVVSAAALSYSAVEATVTKTSTFTTLPTAITVTAILNHTTTVLVYSGGTELSGNCTVTNYFVPDTVQVYMTNITVGSGNTTYTYSTLYQEGPQTGTQVSTSYPTMIYANTTGTFTYVSTSTGNYAPSEGWTVTACTFDG